MYPYTLKDHRQVYDLYWEKYKYNYYYDRIIFNSLNFDPLIIIFFTFFSEGKYFFYYLGFIVIKLISTMINHYMANTNNGFDQERFESFRIIKSNPNCDRCL